MSKPDATDAADGGCVDMVAELLRIQDQFSLGERLRLAAALADAAAKDAVAERARLGWQRAQQIVDAVARDLRKVVQ